MLQVPELEERKKEFDSLITRLCLDIVQGDLWLLLADVSNDDEATVCSGHGGEVFGTALVSKWAVLSDAHRLRLYQQVAKMPWTCGRECTTGICS